MALTVAVFVLATPISAPAARLPEGDYVGHAGKTAFGAALGTGGVVVYACDGHVGTWFKGSAFKGSSRTLRNGAKRLGLTFDHGKLRARSGGRVATLRRAKGKAGLYRSENLVSGVPQLGGWVVQPSGKQVGVVATGSALAAAPKLSTTTLTAGSLVAAPVVAPSDPLPLLVDLDDDGLDVSGSVTTSLLGGGSRVANWTRSNDDDAFVVLDSAVLKTKGYALSVSGRVLARGGIQVTRGSVTTTAVDGFHLLRLLDGNGDGILSPVDPAFEALLLFADRNGDGSAGNFGDTPGIGGGDMVAKMAAMNMEFLALQVATQVESRKFTTLSNASRARHDIAMNAIRSLK